MAGKANLATMADTGRDADLEGARLGTDPALGFLNRGLQTQLSRAAGVGLLEADLDLGGLILPALAEEVLAPAAGAATGLGEGIPEAT